MQILSLLVDDAIQLLHLLPRCQDLQATCAPPLLKCELLVLLELGLLQETLSAGEVGVDDRF